MDSVTNRIKPRFRPQFSKVTRLGIDVGHAQARFRLVCRELKLMIQTNNPDRLRETIGELREILKDLAEAKHPKVGTTVKSHIAALANKLQGLHVRERINELWRDFGEKTCVLRDPPRYTSYLDNALAIKVDKPGNDRGTEGAEFFRYIRLARPIDCFLAVKNGKLANTEHAINFIKSLYKTKGMTYNPNQVIDFLIDINLHRCYVNEYFRWVELVVFFIDSGHLTHQPILKKSDMAGQMKRLKQAKKQRTIRK